MSDKPIPKSSVIGSSAGQEDLIITNEESVDEFTPPESFSESERIHILAEIMDIATHSRENAELFEGCIQKIFNIIPNAERATILVDFRGELHPVKWIPREQAYYSETCARETKEKRKSFSWLRKYATGEISDSMYDVAAAMYAPMIRNGRVIGVVHVDSTSLIEGFTKSELDMVSVIASTLALSLQPGVGEQVVPSVFISYSHKDSRIANKIKGDLRRNGISVWIDERLKAADKAWLKQLEIAIREQQYFLFLMTPNCIESKSCQWELKTAKRLKKNIVPLLIEKTEVPASISKLEYIDFCEGYDKGWVILLETVQRKKQE
jgi:hypothetical protein